jgi:hypothetical protein
MSAEPKGGVTETGSLKCVPKAAELVAYRAQGAGNLSEFLQVVSCCSYTSCLCISVYLKISHTAVKLLRPKCEIIWQFCSTDYILLYQVFLHVWRVRTNACISVGLYLDFTTCGKKCIYCMWNMSASWRKPLPKHCLNMVSKKLIVTTCIEPKHINGNSQQII